MNDFHPITLYAIAREALAGWFWPLLILAVVLLVGVIVSVVQARRRGGACRAAGIALVVGLIVSLAAFFFVPAWTLADLGALAAPVDYLFAVLLALIPGAAVAAAVFWGRIAAGGRAGQRDERAATTRTRGVF